MTGSGVGRVSFLILKLQKNKKAYILFMNNTIQNIKIDEIRLKIVETVSRTPFEEFTIEKIKENIDEKANYPTIYRKVDSLIKEGILSKSMYGMASQIKINLKNEKTISLLSLIETKKFELFFSKLKGVLLTSINEVTKNARDIPEFKCVLIFGSYSKRTYTKKSDMDILVIYEPSRFIPKENYEVYIKEIKSAMIGAFRVNELRGGPKINPIMVSSEEHKEMITNKEINVAKETLINHLILKGYSGYWREISECI